MHIVPVASERGELRQGALPRVEAVEQWKTVLRGRADGRSGGWVGRAGHNHTEWAFSEPARVSPERSRRPDQRGVARRSTEVVVVRQLSIRLGPLSTALHQLILCVTNCVFKMKSIHLIPPKLLK